MHFGSNSFYEASYQQAYQSVGSLSMVSLEQIKQDNNIDYLEDVCTYIQQMNINPLWFESESDNDKLKLIELYQLAITYSKNISQNYNAQIQRLEAINKKQRDQNEEKIEQIKAQKESFRKKKDQYKMQKHRRYKKIFHKLKEQLKEGQDESRIQENAHHYPYPPYYGYYPPQHPFPPHYSPPPHYNSPPTPYAQSSNQTPGQSIPLFNPPNPNMNNAQQKPLIFQQQLATNLLAQFSGQNNQKASNKLSLKPQMPTHSGNNVINSKKIDKSFLQDAQSQDDSREHMDSSQILNKYELNNIMQSKKPSAFQPKKSVEMGKSKRNVEMNLNRDDDFDDIGDLTAQSRKSINKQQQSKLNSNKLKKEQTPLTSSNKIKKQSSIDKASRHSNDSYQLAQIDSIVDGIRLGNNQSKFQRGQKTQPFQSKIIPKGLIPHSKNLKFSIPDSISPINEASNNYDLELPANSNISKKASSENTKFFNRQPQRSSQTLPKANSHQQEDIQTLNMQSDSMNINLNPISKVSAKGRENRQSSCEQFGGIAVSNINKKGHKNKQKSEATQRLFMQHAPQRKTNVKKHEEQKPQLLRISQANSESLNQTKNKMIESATVNINTHFNQPINEDFDNIKTSKMGIKKSQSSNSESTEQVFSGPAPPKRASKQQNSNEVIHSNVATPPRLSKSPQINQAKQDQQNYQEQFEQDDEMPEMNNLQESHYPKSKKQIKVEQDDDMPDINNLQESHYPKNKNQLKPLEPKQPQKSQVDIIVPSNQSIQQINKYHKLHNQQFKLIQKKNALNVEASTVKCQDSLQSFEDFIAFIPANSVIAKPSARFLPSKLIRQPKAKVNDPQSLKNVAIEQFSEASTSKQISINLIPPDHQNKVKLLTKQQQASNKKQEYIIAEQIKPQDNLRESNLPVGIMMQSKVISDNSTNKMLNIDKSNQQIVNSNKPQIIVQKNVELEELQEEIYDSSFQDSSRSQINNKQADPLTDFRHQIVAMIKKTQNLKPSAVSVQKFNDKQIQNIIKNVCKVNLNALQASNIKQAQKKLQMQLQRITRENQLKAKKLNDVIKNENIIIKQSSPHQGTQKQKPKTNKLAINNDSLNYSHSYMNQILENKSKNAKVEMKVEADDITNSVVFDNPYTPQPDQGKIPEPSKQPNDKKQPKSSNPFLLQNNKSIGTKQQHNLFKNVGEGISKYDKDDPLQRQIANMMNKKANIKEEEEQDQW